MKNLAVGLFAALLSVPVVSSARISQLSAAETIEHPALSLLGPFGPTGPFSELGPLGSSAGSPLFWWKQVSQMNVWSAAPQGLFEWFGPMSGLGPLGRNGPLSASAVRAWVLQYGAENVYSVFGPFGPMGALGPLGPLGPLGAVESTGLHRHEDGYYIDKAGKKVAEVTVDGRTFPIFEDYETTYGNKLGDKFQLDTSFMLRDQLGGTKAHSYGIASKAEQTVFVLAVPLIAMQNVVLKVKDAAGKVIAVSDKITMANHLKLQVPRGERFQIEVDSLYGFEDYRLIVVGAGRVLP